MAQFLSERGLELSHEKTRITHSTDGFDFLGQTVRRFDGGKVLLRPSARSVKAFLAKIREVINEHGGQGAGELIRAANARIKGWTMHHRRARSKRIFARVDDRIFRMLRRWCRKRHRQKSRKRIKQKYFKRFGQRDWVFAGSLRDGKARTRPICLMEAARVPIIRRVKVRGEANPYDPEWEGYFEERLHRKMEQALAGREQIRYLRREQQGRCGNRGQLLREGEPWQVHHKKRRSQGGDDGLDNLELFHANCHRQRHSNEFGMEPGCTSQEVVLKA